MAIAFTCDGCGAAYKVPDEYAGKRTACKSCKTPLTVPTTIEEEFEVVEEEFEVVEDEPPLVKPKPKSLRAALSNDDDQPAGSRRRRDEDDEDDEPRPKRKVSSAARDYADLLDEKERKEAAKERKRKKYPKRENSGFVTPGVMGGIVTVVVAVIWLGLGIIILDKLFFCPLFLAPLGMFQIIKGLITGEE